MKRYLIFKPCSAATLAGRGMFNFLYRQTGPSNDPKFNNNKCIRIFHAQSTKIGQTINSILSISTCLFIKHVIKALHTS